MTITKKAKIAQYDELLSERDLLRHYFWDMQRVSNLPETTFRLPCTGGKIRFQVFHTEAAHGGYIVITQFLGGHPMADIHYWDKWQAYVQALPFDGTEYSNLMRSALEVLRRNLANVKAYNESHT